MKRGGRARPLPLLAGLLGGLLAVASAACIPLPRPGDPATEGEGQPPGEVRSEGEASARDGAAEAPSSAAPAYPLSERARVEAERLRELGPVYTPYDRGPRIRWDEASQRAVVDELAPLVEAEGLPLRTRTLLWVLVGADGVVVDATVQTRSSSEAFDRAALELVAALPFVPALAEGRRVPVWVIREVSLLMQ